MPTPQPKMARAILFDESTKSILTMVKSEDLPRRRRDGKPGMTKGVRYPRTVPGGKTEGSRDQEDAVRYFLLAHAGLDFDSLGAKLIKTGFVKEVNTDVLLYTIPAPVDVTCGEGINELQWMPVVNALDGIDGWSILKRCLFVTAGPLYKIDRMFSLQPINSRSFTISTIDGAAAEQNLFAGMPATVNEALSSPAKRAKTE